VAFLGETPVILFGLRLAVTLCYLATLWGTCLAARALFGRRAGLWSAALLALVPVFFFKSIEYRADDLWAALWVLAIAVLVGGAWTLRRSMAAGLVLGAALSASLKTVLLLGTLALAALLTLGLAPGPRGPLLRRAAPRLAALAAGFAVLPLFLTLYFAVQDSLGPFLYGTVLHNVLPGLGSWSDAHSRALFFPPGVLLVVAFVRWIVGLPHLAPGVRARLTLVSLTSLLYLLALHTLWPLFTTQDFLPFYPLLSVAAVGLALEGWRRLLRSAAAPRVPRWAASGVALMVATAALLIGLMLIWEPPSRNGTLAETRLLKEVIRLTGPADPILDLKGETVFRLRPIYYVMETITGARLRRGDLPERIREQAIATRTCVAVADIARFPERTRHFLEDNYLPIGRLRVAGRLLPPAADPGRPISFDVTIPSRYAIVTEHGAASGSLDGEPYTGPRLLAAGRHAFAPSSGMGRLALVWAQAIERGFSPFPPADGAS